MIPKWLEVAEKDLGIKEIPGKEHHPRIVEFHRHTTLKATTDEVAWCSSAVNCWMDEAGYKGTGSAAAKSWLDWGVALETPRLGCICIIRQKQKGPDEATGSTSGYHVGLWKKEEGGRVYLHGGNQGNMVKVSGFGLGSYDILGYRWPLEA